MHRFPPPRVPSGNRLGSDFTMLICFLIVSFSLSILVVLCTCLWLNLRLLSWHLVEEKTHLFIE